MKASYFAILAFLSLPPLAYGQLQATDAKAPSFPPLTLVKTGTMPAEVKESSGLAKATSPGLFYTHGDAGTEPALFVVDAAGKLHQKITLPVANKDWESLATDAQGNLYLCDCGNNDNNRRDLAVYKVHPEAPDKVEQIRFSYPDQKRFPPKKKERNFDSEASLWHNGRLYLFSRDRGSRQTSNVYTLPATPGTHVATKIASLPINGEVTSASISPDGRRLALLTKGQLYLFQAESMEGLLKATPTQVSLHDAGQTEGSEFIDNHTLLISSEEGSLYQVKLP